MKNPGHPLDRAGRVVRGKDVILGFMIIEAHDLEEAAELSAGCPMLQGDGSVEIRPVAKLSS